MTDGRDGYELAPAWLSSKNLQSNGRSRLTSKPATASDFFARAPVQRKTEKRPTSTSSPSNYPPLNKNLSFLQKGPQHSWGQRQNNDRFRAAAATSPKADAGSSVGTGARLASRRGPGAQPEQFWNKPKGRPGPLYAAKTTPEKIIVPLNAAQSQSTGSTGQMQSLETKVFKKRIPRGSIASMGNSFENNNDETASSGGDNGDDGDVEIPFVAVDHSPPGDVEFFKMLAQDWEIELKNTQPLSKREIEQWAITRPDKAREKLNNMKARGLFDGSVPILSAALETLPVSV